LGAEGGDFTAHVEEGGAGHLGGLSQMSEV
jgi:hypothetical protein